MSSPDADGTLLPAGPAPARGFAQVPNRVLRNRDLTTGARLTYALLLSYAWQRGYCFPGHDRLCEDLAVHRNTLRAWLLELRAAGLVSWRRRGQGKSNLYLMHIPQETVHLDAQPDVQLDAHQAVQGKKTQNENTQRDTNALEPVPAGSKAVAEEGRKIRRKPEEIATWRPEVFARFWEFSGKIGSVVGAAREWDRLRPDDELLLCMWRAIEAQAKAFGWGEEDGQAQPHFESWLRKQRWLDELVPTKVRRVHRGTR